MFAHHRTYTLFVFYLLFLAKQAASGCANGFMQLDVLRRRAEKIPNGQTSTNMLNDEFRVVPELNFTCSGTITSLLLGVDFRSVAGSRNQYPVLQIWRKNSTNEYSLQDRQQITLDARDFSPDGVLQYNLTSPLQFQSGDLLGVHQPQQRDSVVRLYYSVNNSAPVAIQIANVDPSLLSSITIPGGFGTVDDQYTLLSPITDPPCTSGFLSPTILRQLTLDVNINRVRGRGQQQRLFPDIHFTCNGSITKWIVGAEMRVSGTEQPELQIWRRDSGGGNSYTKTNFSLLTPNETSDPNIHEYYPDTPLEFQEGDILGVYQPRSHDSQLVVYYQENTGPTNYRQDNVDPPAPSTFILGKPILSQIDYPLVTVEISTDFPASVIPEFTPTILAEPSIISSATSSHEVPMTPAVMTPGTSSSQPIHDGTDMRKPLVTQMPSISSLPTHLPDPYTGNVVTIIATVVSIVVVLIIIVVVCIVLIAVPTCLKGSHHKHMKSQDNVCYSTSSRNENNEGENQSEPNAYSCISVDAEHTDPPIDVDQNGAYQKCMDLQDNVCYLTSFRNEVENQSEPGIYSCVLVDVEQTDPSVDVDQNVAYQRHIELQDNVCYTTSFRSEETEDGSDPHAYAYIPVDVQHTIPAQPPAMTVVENAAYGAVLTTNM